MVPLFDSFVRVIDTLIALSPRFSLSLHCSLLPLVCIFLCFYSICVTISLLSDSIERTICSLFLLVFPNSAAWRERASCDMEKVCTTWTKLALHSLTIKSPSPLLVSFLSFLCFIHFRGLFFLSLLFQTQLLLTRKSHKSRICMLVYSFRYVWQENERERTKLLLFSPERKNHLMDSLFSIQFRFFLLCEEKCQRQEREENNGEKEKKGDCVKSQSV